MKYEIATAVASASFITMLALAGAPAAHQRTQYRQPAQATRVEPAPEAPTKTDTIRSRATVGRIDMLSAFTPA